VKRLALPFLLVILAACSSASNPKPVDVSEPRRALGNENDVRIDVEIYTDRLRPNTTLPLKYDVTNHRRSTILVADLIPDATYDPDTRTVTINLGSEIPGENFLPRLIAVRPEERKSFSTSAHVNIPVTVGSPWTPRPSAVRVRLNFLDDTTTFAKLIDIPERAVHDPKLAADIFQKWIDTNETVVTNTLPMHWEGNMAVEGPSSMAPSPRGRGRGDRPPY
jgi:hypothetical protein